MNDQYPTSRHLINKAFCSYFGNASIPHVSFVNFSNPSISEQTKTWIYWVHYDFLELKIVAAYYF